MLRCVVRYVYSLTFYELSKVLLVSGALGVLPVEVEAVEAMLSQVGRHAVHKRATVVAVGRHVLELLGAERPAAWESRDFGQIYK